MFFKMRSAYFVAALSAVLSVAAVASAKYKAQDPKIQVHAKGPGGMKIDGKSPKLIIDEDDKSVTFKTFLNTIDTGNGMRNEHMQERFEAAKYPDIKLTVDKDKIDDKKGGSLPGTLTFHGVAKKVDVKYDVKGKHVHAGFNFDVSNHKIDKDQLCAFHVCADSAVSVEVDFDLAG
ncbi:MAG: YceI family protein [Pseudomonadota bacterium]